MRKQIILIGVVTGLLGIVLGAFGAHGLQTVLNETAIKSFETGVRYQMYHALFLLFVGIISNQLPLKKVKKIVRLTVVGLIAFSGSIYVFSLMSMVNTIEIWPVLRLVTPVGGLCFIAAWLLLGLTSYKSLK